MFYDKNINYKEDIIKTICAPNNSPSNLCEEKCGKIKGKQKNKTAWIQTKQNRKAEAHHLWEN